MQEEYLDEQLDLGSYSVDRSGSAIIKNANRLESPITGKINNSLVKSSCNSGFAIESSNKNYFIEYCNVTDVRINNNQKINESDLLGKSSNDVQVTLYNKKGKKIKIDSQDAMILVNGKETGDTKDKDPKNSEYKKDKSYDDSSGEPLITGLFQLPFKLISAPFKNKYDKSGKLTQKRWGSPVDKRQVDPWILQSIKDPFGIKRRKKENEDDISGLSENNKLNEEINRIKELLK